MHPGHRNAAGSHDSDADFVAEEGRALRRIQRRSPETPTPGRHLIDELAGFSDEFQEMILRKAFGVWQVATNTDVLRQPIPSEEPQFTEQTDDDKIVIDVENASLLLQHLEQHVIRMNTRGTIAKLIRSEGWKPRSDNDWSNKRGEIGERTLQIILEDFIAANQLKGHLDVVHNVERIDLPARYTLIQHRAHSYILLHCNQKIAEFDVLLCAGNDGEKLYCLDATLDLTKDLEGRWEKFSKFSSNLQRKTSGRISANRIDFTFGHHFERPQEIKPGIWQCHLGIRNAIHHLLPARPRCVGT